MKRLLGRSRTRGRNIQIGPLEEIRNQLAADATVPGQCREQVERRKEGPNYCHVMADLVATSDTRNTRESGQRHDSECVCVWRVAS